MSLPQRAARPQVWVIILNWNGGGETVACIEALRESSHPARVLVVDNGSRDGSPAQIAARCPEAELLELGANTGFSAGVNRGIVRALAGGADYVLLLNNDARAAPDMLERLVGYAEANPGCGMVSPLIYQLERPERLWVAGGLWRVFEIVHAGWDAPDSGQYAAPTDFDMVFGTALLIRRALIERVGLFDERFFVYYEDADLSLRARRAGYRLVVVPSARLWHAGAFSTRHHHYLKEFHMARSRVLFYRKHLPRPHFLAFLLLQLPADLRHTAALLRRGALAGGLGCAAGALAGLRQR